jgi:hypothetical protein
VTDVPRARSGPLLNENQRRRVLASCQYIDRMLSDLDKVVALASSGSPFDRYVDDLTKEQKTLLREYSASIRAQMLRVLESQGAMPLSAPGSARHAIRSGLNFIEIALEELKPQHMRGSGEMAAEAIPELNGLVQELQALVRRLDATLGQEASSDLHDRVAGLGPGAGKVRLQALERVILRHGLVECRPAIEAILESCADRRAERGGESDEVAAAAIESLLARKAGALRAGVEAALRTRLGQHQRTAKAPVDAAAIETELRKAAGAFEDVRKLCDPLRDPSPRVVFEALELAAERAIKALDFPESHPGGLARSVEAAVRQVGVDRAEDIRPAINQLITKVRAALGAAAGALGLPEPASADEWAALRREMPAFEIGTLAVEPKLFLRKALGSSAGHARMRRAIETQVGDRISASLNAHGLALYGWSQQVLARVRQQFDAQAEIYRAQLSRPAGAGASGDVSAIERDLAELSNF